jgi:hypothetical protein
MAYHIRISRGIHCEVCSGYLNLLSPYDALAKREAEEYGWKHKKDGWICKECLTAMLEG